MYLFDMYMYIGLGISTIECSNSFCKAGWSRSIKKLYMNCTYMYIPHVVGLHTYVCILPYKREERKMFATKKAFTSLNSHMKSRYSQNKTISYESVIPNSNLHSLRVNPYW